MNTVTDELLQPNDSTEGASDASVESFSRAAGSVRIDIGRSTGD